MRQFGEELNVRVDISAKPFGGRRCRTVRPAGIAPTLQQFCGLTRRLRELRQELASESVLRATERSEMRAHARQRIQRPIVAGKDEPVAEAGTALIGRFGMPPEPQRDGPARPGIDAGPVDPIEASCVAERFDRVHELADGIEIPATSVLG